MLFMVSCNKDKISVLFMDRQKMQEGLPMSRSDLNTECKDLKLIIDGLAAGEETYNEEETQYSLEEALDYLRGFLQELNDLNDQIIMNGNTAELLEEVHKKYTELWLFQLYFHVYSLPRVIGGLLRYPNDE